MKERLNYIDTAKGILILMMLIGHVWNTGPVHDFVYSFHMPAFIMISGILLGRSSSLKLPCCRFAFKKVKELILPCLGYELYGLLVSILLYGATLNAKGYFFELLSLHLYNGPLWFLWVLFFAEIGFFVLYKATKGFSGYVRYIILLALFVLLMVLPQYQAYINITTTMLTLFFLITGFVVNTNHMKQSWALIALLLLATITLSKLNHGVGMPDYQEGIRLVFIISSLSGTFFILLISHFIDDYGYKAFNIWGKNSLFVLGSHYPIIRICKKLLNITEFSVFTGIIFLSVLILLEYGCISLFCTLKKKAQFRKQSCK